MKTCPTCKSEVEDTFGKFLNCQFSFVDGVKLYPENQTVSNGSKLCLRFDVPMEFQGNFRFHEGSKIGVLGNLFELFTNRESFDLYNCPNCGKVDFFLPGFK
ncbi:MAG: hypothetical protein IPL63_16580 [Saprospiraceae bacterium]|nr:hypothetical protein [Saprospiraceae bacterium]MBK7523374.1 hypothetical protein [Saprospiraceae bacterium]MBK8079472.1 hypothetical protein [Saprospiraceae bacterium]MBK8371636.1 hypothetical protein [Saprospiraceae bacterium]MBK8548899.1 hypothetical protein [Saprospiraceae bacterium]